MGRPSSECDNPFFEATETNAYEAVCTDCGAEDTLPFSDKEGRPEIGEVVKKFFCDCGATSWEVTGYDHLVFQRESRYAQGPDITGSWHHYNQLEWRQPLFSDDEASVRPVCPVSQLGSCDEKVPCSRIAKRLTDNEGRGAWICGWHGHFRVFGYPRGDEPETEQASLGET